MHFFAYIFISIYFTYVCMYYIYIYMFVEKPI
jgi:hypothetical protein